MQGLADIVWRWILPPDVSTPWPECPSRQRVSV